MRWGLSAGVALLLLTCAAPVQGQLGSWELGIDYPQDNEDMPFSVGTDGGVSIQFFVNNEELVDIGVEFDYEIPFGGEDDGPESETIGAGDNKSFTLTVSGADDIALAHYTPRVEAPKLAGDSYYGLGHPSPMGYRGLQKWVVAGGMFQGIEL